MAQLHRGRVTAAPADPFVVFIIGMRINSLVRVGKWWPVMAAMPRMIRELEARPELGFLGYQQWLGRTTIMLQYWASFEKLEAYAKAPEHAHLPAWRDFNRRARNTDAVGVWHETYLAQPGSYEAIYVNMPPTGLGRVAPLVPATGRRDAARGRMTATAKDG